MQTKFGRSAPLMLATCLVMALGGCQKEATGQVAAVVNGEEITLQELNAEMGALNIPQGANQQQVRSQVLQRLVDRRLLAQQAAEAGVDRDPEYLLRKRGLEEALLIQLYGKKAQDTLRVPDAAAINRYVASHPSVFANRTIFTVDQLRVANLPDRSVLDALRDVHSQDGVIAVLQQRNIPFQRGTGRIDSAQVPPEVLKQVQALPPGEPFIVPAGGGMTVSVITGTEPARIPEAQARPVAVQAMRNEELAKIMEQRLNDAKAKAEIEYQSGFAPAPNARPSAAATARPAA